MIRRIEPTYDGGHYRARAERYARAATHEPDPAVKAALEATAKACRARAERDLDEPSVDVAWKE
jgi:hypothetical protein